MTFGWKGLYFTMRRGKKGHWENGGISQELFHKNIYFFISHFPNRVQTSPLFLNGVIISQQNFPLVNWQVQQANSTLDDEEERSCNIIHICLCNKSLLLNETRCKFSSFLFLFSLKVNIMVSLKTVRRNFFFTV